MTCQTVNATFKVALKVMKYANCDIDSADRIIAPLTYWLGTGRASGTEERIFCHCNERQLTTIAKRLIAYNGMDYDKAISSIKNYINHIKE